MWSFVVAFFLALSIATFLLLAMVLIRPQRFPKLARPRMRVSLALVALGGYLVMAISLTLKDPLLHLYNRYGPAATIYRIPGYFPPRGPGPHR
jgi:Na+-driven multidrug efflux pump